MKKDKKDSASKKGFFSNISIKFGEMAKRLGLISNSDIEEALSKQESGQERRRIGMVLVEDNKMTTKEVNEVLNSQSALETFMADKEEKVSAKKITKKSVKKKPARKTTKKSVKKKLARKTTKKSVKKKPAGKTTKKSVKKKPAKRKPSK